MVHVHRSTIILLMAFTSALSAAELLRGAGGSPTRDDFAVAWGVDREDHPNRFARRGDLSVEQIAGTVPANIAYPGDRPAITVQVRNHGAQPLPVAGRWLLVEYALVTKSADVFDLGLVRLGETALQPLAIDLPATGFADVEVQVDLPERFAAFAVLLERDDGVRLFAASVARTMRPAPAQGQRFHQMAMDLDRPTAISRLGTAPNRIEIPYNPTSHPETARERERSAERLRAIHATGFPVIVEFGVGASRGDHLPLGRSRPHLDDQDVLKGGKQDYTWLPSYDDDFKAYAKTVASEFGWPKGPVNAMKFMNEPWNGISISGWGADDLRYREIYTKLCVAVEEARAEAGVEVLLGGCDSSSNTFDKLFPDGDLAFLDRLDFMSLHYQGLNPSNARMMRDRQHANGRVQFWDTESWVANSQDRVPGALAGMLAAGYDRIVGIQSHSVVATPWTVAARLADGTVEQREIIHAWPVAPAQIAFNTLVGNRTFRDLVFAQALPWIFRFQGDNADDLVLVVCGDLAPIFGADNVPLRSVRGLAEVRRHEDLRATLATLPADAAERGELQRQLDRREPLSGAHMTVPADVRWSLLDGSGNTVPAVDGRLHIPLDGSGWYLRPSGAAGSGEALIAAVRAARIDGYAPVAIEVHDAVAPIASRPSFRLSLRNVLNRPIAGTLSVKVAGLQTKAPEQLSFAAHQERHVDVAVVGGEADARNLYDLALRFDAGADGLAVHHEQVRVNLIHARRIVVDGDLAEWQDAIPQPVAQGGGGPTLMETAWLPMVQQAPTMGKGYATAWVAADDEGFAIAAKIADDTPDPGQRRWADLDPSYCFYPEVAHQIDAEHTRTAWVRPTKAGHAFSPALWQPVASHMTFTLDLPGERLVSLGFSDDDDRLRRATDVEVTDAAGKRLARVTVKSQRGIWLRLRLSGQVTITVGSRQWLPATLAAVAVDPLPADADAGPVLGEERTKPGSLAGLGADLLLLPGQPPRGDVSASWSTQEERVALQWPEGVRRFSYRMRPALVQGTANDNMQIAFNVLSDDAKPWYPAAPGTFKGYAGYWCSDYEFALNQVAEAYGSGYEVWSLRAPGQPDKHFYPRQPKYPGEGPVVGAQLVVRREPGLRIIEAKIPWAAIPEVARARAEGRPIRFSYRVNDNAGAGCMELSRGRSVAKRNGSFKPDWVEHWANEVAFGWER